MTPLELKAIEILKTYTGSNDYILWLKRQLDKNNLVLTRNQAKYIKDNHQVRPALVNKMVAIHPYYGSLFKKMYRLDKEPTEILIFKILSRTKHETHVWGAFEKDAKYHMSIHVNNRAFIRTKQVKKLVFDAYKRPPKPHQVVAIEKLLANDRYILADDMGLGKAVVSITPVLTPTGWKKIKDLKVGDDVCDIHGNVVKVTGYFPQGTKDAYKVTFTDNTTVVCCDEHLWEVNTPTRKKRNNPGMVMALGQIITKGYKEKNGNLKYYIPTVKHVAFEEQETRIDPYLMGLLLGDGSLTQKGVSITSADEEILMYCSYIAERYDTVLKPKDQHQSFIFSKLWSKNILYENIKNYNLAGCDSENKFIPDQFLFNSEEVRLAILQGLLDTDGYVAKDGTIQYYTVSPKLSEGFTFLVQSLGGVVKRTEKFGSYQKDGVKVLCKKCYVHTVNVPESIIPFRLQRKIDRLKTTKKYNPTRGIKNIEYVGQEDMVCISVSSKDKLFVVNDFIVTHNTTSAIIAAVEGGFKKILVVCPASLKLNWKKEISNYDDINDISVVSGADFRAAKWTIVNYDILKNFHSLPVKEDGVDITPPSIINFHKYDLVIADECFQYNTLVDTNVGKIPIGYIVENGLDVKILSYNTETEKLEYKKIERWIKKENDTILRINLSNGLSIECTPNHKIYVNNKGYIRADEILSNDELLTLPEGINEKTDLEKSKVLLKEMFGEFPTYKSSVHGENEIEWVKTHERTSGERMSVLSRGVSNRTEFNEEVLQYQMFGEMEDESTRNQRKSSQLNSLPEESIFYEIELSKKSSESQKFFRENEEKQPHVQTRKCEQDGSEIERKNIFIQRREWSANQTTTKVKRFTRRRLDHRTPNRNKGSKKQLRIVTNFLQGGSWVSHFKNSHRSGWKKSQDKKMEIFGQTKNRSLRSVRVASVEILESGSGRTARNMSGQDKTVYNIEVSDNHNYFADNILVSNCHYLKNASSNRTKLFFDFGRKIQTRWLLTGTPITNKPVDFFSLLDICDSPLAENWVGYVRRYCDGKQFSKKGGGKFWVTGGASNLEELRTYTQDLMLRRTKKELNLPPKTKKPVYLPLTMTSRYNSYMLEYESWLEEMRKIGEEPPEHAHLTKLGAVRQLLAQDKMEHTIALAQDYIDEGHKVIIFSCFTETIRGIHEHFGKQSVLVDGSVSSTKRQAAVDAFQENNKVMVFCGNIVAAGVGLTLTKGSIVIFNDLDWVPTNHMQAEDRCIAAGQPVITKGGFKKIEDVEIGDLVYTHKGNWKHVIDKTSKLERAKTFIDVKYKGFDTPLTCTEDHKIYTYHKNTKTYQWVEAYKLDPNVHYLVLSKPKLENSGQILELELPFGENYPNNLGAEQSNGRLKQPFRCVQLTEDLMFALGWYLAEGWSCVAENKGSSVSVCGNLNSESEVVKRVMTIIKESFGLTNSEIGCYETNKNCISNTLYSKNLAHNFLKWFGSDSHNKKIPDFVYSADKVLIKSFLAGYYAGDGYERKNTQQATTASDQIAIGLCILESSLNNPVTLRKSVKEHWSFEYSIPEKTQRKTLIKTESDGILYPITEVRRYKPKRGKERVFDLTVEDDHSFTVGLSAVHNCHRMGQENEVHILYPLVADTIDEGIFETLMKKMMVISQITGDDVDQSMKEILEVLKSHRRAK